MEAVGPQVQTTSGDTRVMFQGDLIVGKVAMGAGTLNPAGAIALLRLLTRCYSEGLWWPAGERWRSGS